MNDSSLTIAAGTLSAWMRGDGSAARLHPGRSLAAERDAAAPETSPTGTGAKTESTPGSALDAAARATQAQPAKETQAVQAPMSTAEIEDVLNDVNEFLKTTQRALEFSVDDATGLQVITVRDTETEEVIRQIPPEVVVALIKHFRDNQEIHATGVAEKA